LPDNLTHAIVGSSSWLTSLVEAAAATAKTRDAEAGLTHGDGAIRLSRFLLPFHPRRG